MRIAGVLLAAGRGTRFGASSKLMADLCGHPLVDWAAAAMEGAGLSRRAAIVRPGEDAVQAVLSARGFAIIENPSADEGMGASIAAGAAWASEQDADGLLIALGDAPLVSAETIGRLLGAFSPADGRSIVVARDGGRRGGLVVFSRTFLPSLAALRGDAGGRSLLTAHAEVVAEVECATPGELDDVDTPEALAAARERIAREGLQLSSRAQGKSRSAGEGGSRT